MRDCREQPVSFASDHLNPLDSVSCVVHSEVDAYTHIKFLQWDLIRNSESFLARLKWKQFVGWCCNSLRDYRECEVVFKNKMQVLTGFVMKLDFELWHTLGHNYHFWEIGFLLNSWS